MRGEIKAFSLDVTSRCNLRCAHCYNESGADTADSLTHEELLRTAGEIAEFHPESVCLCGGEPLMLEGILEIMDVLRTGTGSLSMVSNGLRITQETARELKAHGLDAIQISLDGAFAWQHDSLRGRRGAFAGAVRAVRVLKEAGIRQVFVSMIPNILNYGTMEAYFRLCVSLDISLLKFMPFMPMGRGKSVGRSLMLDEEEMFRFQRQLSGLKELYGDHLTVEWDDPVRSARFLCERLQSGLPPLILCVTAGGDVRTDVYAPVRLGNVREGSLTEICARGMEEARREGRFLEILRRLHGMDDLGQ